MQGDKLFPGHKNVVRSRLRLRTPDRRRGDGLVHAGSDFSQSAATKFGEHSLAIERGTHGELVAANGLYSRLAKIQGTTFIEESFAKISLA